MTGRLTAVLVGLVAMVSTTPARAQAPTSPQFTFTVPLRLTNMPPEISSYDVLCQVYETVGGTRGLAIGNTVGFFSGSVNRDVVVTVTITSALVDPARAIEYSCGVYLRSAGGPPYLDPSSVNIPLLSGAPYRSIVRGPIPR